MRQFFLFTMCVAIMVSAACTTAQPPGGPPSPEMINRQLPLEGAPLAIPGPYTVTQEAAFEDPRFIVFRPISLSTFPTGDNLPLVVWGNGGCALENPQFFGFLSTIASHGFMVMTTLVVEPEEGEEPRTRGGTGADLLAAIDWAEAENAREASHLFGKIDTGHIAAYGQSCGGFAMAAPAAFDPRVDTTGLFNAGLQEGSGQQQNGRPTMNALVNLHGPVLLINGGEPDFASGISRANFDAIDHVPAFYGARDNAGHLATFYHPGGGEFANVASNWLLYHFKDDAVAGRMFVGEDCDLCNNPNWETDSKGFRQ